MGSTSFVYVWIEVGEQNDTCVEILPSTSAHPPKKTACHFSLLFLEVKILEVFFASTSQSWKGTSSSKPLNWSWTSLDPRFICPIFFPHATGSPSDQPDPYHSAGNRKSSKVLNLSKPYVRSNCCSATKRWGQPLIESWSHYMLLCTYLEPKWGPRFWKIWYIKMVQFQLHPPPKRGQLGSRYII